MFSFTAYVNIVDAHLARFAKNIQGLSCPLNAFTDTRTVSRHEHFLSKQMTDLDTRIPDTRYDVRLRGLDAYARYFVISTMETFLRLFSHVSLLILLFILLQINHF